MSHIRTTAAISINFLGKNSETISHESSQPDRNYNTLTFFTNTTQQSNVQRALTASFTLSP